MKSQIDHSSVFSSYLPEKTGPGDLQNDVFFDDFWYLPARWPLKVARVSQRATNRTPKVDQLLTRWLLKVARVSQRASNRTPKVDQPLTKWSKKCSGRGHPVQLQRFPYSPGVQFLKKSLNYHHGGMDHRSRDLLLETYRRSYETSSP